MPTLVLLRHAKTEPQGADDHGRRLTPVGRADAEQVRRWLSDEGLVPDRVVVSTATRARETWELAAVGDVTAEHDERLYEASPEELREVVAESGPDVRTVLLVAHNPAVERLAWELDDSDSARERTDRGMRPGGVAVFSLADWSAPHGRLVALR